MWLLHFVSLIYSVETCLGFLPHIQMPYKLIAGGGFESNVIGTTMTCNEERNSIKTCATECLEREKAETGCPGFYNDPANENCFICHISSMTEVQNSQHTTFLSNHKVYLLLGNQVVPEVSMNFDNYTENTIYGKNTLGTIVGGSDNHVTGKKNQGFRCNENKIVLTGLETECWTNLDHCTDGVSFSIWFKPNVIKTSYVFSTGTAETKGVAFLLQPGRIETIVTLNSGSKGLNSITSFVADQWYLLTGLYHHVDGIKSYVNGQYETSRVLTSTYQTGTNSHVDWGARVGVKLGIYESHPFDGTVDELKYYYRLLNPTEIWREYVGYDIDLTPVPVISADGSTNDPQPLVDGDYGTCVQISADNSCWQTMKVKMTNWNGDVKNITTTIFTENLDCNSPMVYVYDSSTTSDQRHFTGNFKRLHLQESRVVNGLNKCVFNGLFDDPKYYVFAHIANVAQDGIVKICEIQF